MVDAARIVELKPGEGGKGPVVYWMSRDQRVEDNWALLFAADRALELKTSLVVAFALAPSFLAAPLRHYDFMFAGLKEAEEVLAERRIPFFLLEGDPGAVVPEFSNSLEAAMVVADFDPLRVKRDWKRRAAFRLAAPLYEADAHNVVPCRFVSDHAEFGAYTLRPKVKRNLDRFLSAYPVWAAFEKAGKRAGLDFPGQKPVAWGEVLARLAPDISVPPVPGITPGPKAAAAALTAFLETRLEGYAERRNDPLLDGQSGLSPYLHFGQLSAQRVALEARKSPCLRPDLEAFLEELIVRRELADNYCFYNENYDSAEGFPRWGRETLKAHERDRRDALYTHTDFETARTHEDLWNAAQNQLVRTGKLHGYLRMYWAKKILEWSPSPADALRTAIALNDRFSLDGRDPNGYAGCAWAIGGVHDRPWRERPVYGKIRYMNRNGAKRKFDVAAFVERWK